jgi:hypothetical protein
MAYWTWADIKEKVEADLDLESEDFIPESELLGYANEAIREVSRQLHTLYEDYFLTRTTITLVSGQEEYSLPSDIYAMKIRGMVYRNGTSVWKMKRIQDWRKFEEYEFDKTNLNPTALYGFFILNQTAGSPKIMLTPTPNENGAYVRLWYIRTANELTADASVCDIPEAVNYVIQYIKVRCYEKELHPNLPKAMQDLEMEKQTTLETLSNMVPDVDNEIEADTRLYEEMS